VPPTPEDFSRMRKFLMLLRVRRFMAVQMPVVGVRWWKGLREGRGRGETCLIYRHL
jgi:hypothetical protein